MESDFRRMRYFPRGDDEYDEGMPSKLQPGDALLQLLTSSYTNAPIQLCKTGTKVTGCGTPVPGMIPTKNLTQRVVMLI